MYTTNHGPNKFLIKLQEEKNTSINSISIYIYLFTKLQKYQGHPQSPLFTLLPPLILM